MHYSESTRMMIMMNLCTIKEKGIGRKNKKKNKSIHNLEKGKDYGMLSPHGVC